MLKMKALSAAFILGAVTGCADPSVWSAVAPGFEAGVPVSRLAVQVEQMEEPSRSWSERAMIRELKRLGHRVTEKHDAADALLTMRLTRQKYVTIDVPQRHHPGTTTVTTYEKDGKTVTEIKESAPYTTGGYSYQLPEVKADFTLDYLSLQAAEATVWTANAVLRGERNEGWPFLSAQLAERAVRQLGRDKIVLPAVPLQTVSAE